MSDTFSFLKAALRVIFQRYSYLGPAIVDELTTSIVGIDFPNEDKSKSNRRKECMLCAPGDIVELRLKPKNPFDENAIASGPNAACNWGSVHRTDPDIR